MKLNKVSSTRKNCVSFKKINPNGINKIKYNTKF